jgi:hypothetical protein
MPALGAERQHSMDTSVGIRDAVADAIRYWEPRRIVYNVVLGLVVLAYFAVNWPHSGAKTSREEVLFVFVLAVLANVCYCAAYLGDVFVQLSGLHRFWRRWRWILFAIGTTFAAIITRWFAIAFFAR